MTPQTDKEQRKQDKTRRSSRLIALTKIFSDHPGRLFPLGIFIEQFGAAKSTLSEDVVSIRNSLEESGMGTLETVAGAAGGIRYWPFPSEEREKRLLDELSRLLESPDRILPGNYLYMSDILYRPQLMSQVGEVFAKRFFGQKPDYVMTVETKGISLAAMTAKAFDIPVVVVRRETRVTEGPTVNINYVSGSNRRIHTMSVGKKSLPQGKRVLIIDDFMQAGATAKALVDLVKEVEAEVVGIGVVMATREPEKKLCDQYETLLWLEEIDEDKGKVVIGPA